MKLQNPQDPKREQINRFPATFRLRGRGDRLFRISKSASFVNGDGQVILYTEIHCPDNVSLGGFEWLEYARCTPAELESQIMQDDGPHVRPGGS